MKHFLNALTYIALSIAGIALTGLAISLLWQWFLVPLGVIPIGIAHAFGLSLIVMFFKLRGHKDFVKEVLVQKSKSRQWFECFATPVFAIVIAYITTLFM